MAENPAGLFRITDTARRGARQSPPATVAEADTLDDRLMGQLVSQRVWPAAVVGSPPLCFCDL